MLHNGIRSTAAVVLTSALLSACSARDGAMASKDCGPANTGCASTGNPAGQATAVAPGVTFLVALLKDSAGDRGTPSAEWAYLDHRDSVGVVFNGVLPDSVTVIVSAELTAHRPSNVDDLDTPAVGTRWVKLSENGLSTHSSKQGEGGLQLTVLHPGAIAAGGIQSQRPDERFSRLRVCVSPAGGQEVCGGLRVLLPS